MGELLCPCLVQGSVGVVYPVRPQEEQPQWRGSSGNLDSAPAGTPSAGPGGSGAGPLICSARGGSANPTAQTRSTGRWDTAQDLASPRDRQRPGGPRTARTLLPQLSRSAAPPRSLQALQTESSGATAGAESRAPELAPPLRLFLLGPHGVNNPH